MLLELTVNNFAIIDQVRLSLAPGFNVLTGETGAGKSILIDAVWAVLGGRITSDVIRAGQDEAVVEAVFAVDGEAVRQTLSDAGIEVVDNQLIVSREISRHGRNLCRINGRTVTANIVRQIARPLVDICGQMEQQSLTSGHDQLLLVDRFAGREALTLRGRVTELYREYMELAGVIRDLQADSEARQRRADIFSHQVAEIEQAGLRDGEWEDLEEQRQVLASAESLLAAASRSFEIIYEGRADSAVIDALSSALDMLEEAGNIDGRLAAIVDEVRDCYFRLQSAGRDLARYRDQIVFDPEALNQVEERRELWRELKRKYGDSYEQIEQYKADASRELELLAENDRRGDQARARVQALTVELSDSARALHELRVCAARELEGAVGDQLAALGLEHSRWQLEIRLRGDLNDQQLQGVVSADGADDCLMLFSANPDEDPRDIGKVASGGELARLMLAVKTVIGDSDQVGTIIFDEIDANIGGRMALAVAARIKTISERRQVLCVTHQPQIAAVGNAHYCVSKSVDEGVTRVQVQRLEPSEREEEIARMLGGAELTTVTTTHARELLRSSDEG